MKTMLDLFDALPLAEREAIMEKLCEAMKWRGWEANPNSLHRGHAAQAVREIAEVFRVNGREIMQYT